MGMGSLGVRPVNSNGILRCAPGFSAPLQCLRLSNGQIESAVKNIVIM